ncbi:MAG: hypothetical protein NUV67_04745 [archaeon]|nr:hypothetical protein [archaeon]
MALEISPNIVFANLYVVLEVLLFISLMFILAQITRILSKKNNIAAKANYFYFAIVPYLVYKGVFVWRSVNGLVLNSFYETVILASFFLLLTGLIVYLGVGELTRTCAAECEL